MTLSHQLHKSITYTFNNPNFEGNFNGESIRYCYLGVEKKSGYLPDSGFYRRYPDTGKYFILILFCRLVKSLVYIVPVDHIPVSSNIIGPPVLVFQVICMLPYINGKQRVSLLIRHIHKWIVLVRC